MNLKQVTTINALVYIGIGILFTLYSPVPLAFLGIPNVPELNGIDYWNIAAFSRMFGAALFSFGILIWAVRSILSEVSETGIRGILFSLILGNLILLITPLTQTFSIWQNPTGFLLVLIPLIFMILYIYWMMKSSKRR